MVKPRVKGVYKKKRHTLRSLSVLALIIAITVVAISLSGALTPQTFTLVVHVYDKAKGNPQTIYELNESMIVANVTVTVDGVIEPTRFTPTGIIVYDRLGAGTYQIAVEGNGYISNTVEYLVGPNCPDRTPDGQCHALIPIAKT